MMFRKIKKVNLTHGSFYFGGQHFEKYYFGHNIFDVLNKTAQKNLNHHFFILDF